MPIASTVHVYTSNTCGMPLKIPSQPCPRTLVSNIRCPQRLKMRKYLSSTIFTVSGYNLSLWPSLLGDQALGTKISDLGGNPGGASILTNKVSTISQPLSVVILILYSTCLS